MAHVEVSEKRRIAYDHLPDNIRASIDGLVDARKNRGMTVAGGAGAAVTASKLGPDGIMRVVGTGIGLGLVVSEYEVIHRTRELGNLLREASAPNLNSIRESGFTHVHVTSGKNLVFTKEPRFRGKEILPHPLKPKTWRWRMKVPLAR